MISVITCSRDQTAVDRLRHSIEQTSGVPFEFIVIDNREGRFGLCAAYNYGIRQAKYPYVCFVHEDVVFVTHEWGHRLVNHLTAPGTGLIGIAGGDTRGLVPSGWSIPITSNQMHLLQYYKRDNTSREIFESSQQEGILSARVAAIDGVFMATRMDVLQRFQFDEECLTGFHGYDIDFSLQVGTGYEIRVVFDLLIHHFSEGNQDKNWIKSAEIISNKWKERLPVSVSPDVNGESLRLHHWHTLRIYLETLRRTESGWSAILSGYIQYSFTRFFAFRRFLSLSKFVFFSLPYSDRHKPRVNADHYNPDGIKFKKYEDINRYTSSADCLGASQDNEVGV